jgi:prepilin-type N-terminal cleavage/methylation domain-containing protein
MKKSRGFSLLELLIVVAIILIIATIAIPSLLRSRQAANESSAVANIRTVNTAQVTYMSSHQGEYADTMTILIADGMIDERFDLGQTVSGYAYTIVDDSPSTDSTSYVVTATAVSPNTGRFHYYSGPDAVVRYSGGADSGQPVQ